LFVVGAVRPATLQQPWFRCGPVAIHVSAFVGMLLTHALAPHRRVRREPEQPMSVVDPASRRHITVRKCDTSAPGQSKAWFDRSSVHFLLSARDDMANPF
jgi:hypothetical protein